MTNNVEAGPPELVIDDAIATITLRRPAQANRLTPDDLERLADLLAKVSGRSDVLVLLLRGTGKYFCSGYDIGSIGHDHRVDFASMVDAVEQARPVTIAVLHGSAFGGATDLALACDFRIGAMGINMSMPAARLGVHYYQSGLERYVTRLGLDTAKRLFLTAETLDARQMKEIGFLTHLVDVSSLESEVSQLSRACAGMAPLALLGMKRHLNRIARGTLDAEDLQADIRRAMGSNDLREGLAAWAKKRTPRFGGK